MLRTSLVQDLLNRHAMLHVLMTTSLLRVSQPTLHFLVRSRHDFVDRTKEKYFVAKSTLACRTLSCFWRARQRHITKATRSQCAFALLIMILRSCFLCQMRTLVEEDEVRLRCAFDDQLEIHLPLLCQSGQNKKEKERLHHAT